LALEFVL